MKKTLLFFSAVLFGAVANAQTGSGTLLTLDTAAVAGGSTSSGDQSYIATLPGGENLVASHIKEGGADYINIKKIHTDGTVGTVRNLISTTDPLLGLTCSASGNFTCFFGSGSNFNLVKFSSSGSILWQKSIVIVGETIAAYYGSNHKLMETSSGDYYLLVSNYSFTGLIKIDVNGNLLWSHKMTGPRDTGKCPGFSTEVTQDGGSITALKDENYETLINMDPNGNLRWSRSFGDMSYRWTRSVKSDNLGNFYVMGTYGAGGATFIQKIDANGNLIFAKNLSGSTCFLDAYVTASNDYYILTQTPGFHMAKIGSGGNVIWDKAIGATASSPASQYFTYFTSTPHLADLNFYSIMNDSTNGDIVFRSNDMTGPCNTYSNGAMNVTDDIQIFDATVDTTCKINPLSVTVSNSGFGTTTTEYYQGRDFCSYLASVSEIAPVAELNIFPNPATDQITIELGNIKNASGITLMMYDMTGRKVLESKPGSDLFMTISTAGLANGLYTVLVTGTNDVLGKQKIMIQK